MKNSLKYAFLEFIDHHKLIKNGDKILVAVSGGVDSMVLLHLLRTWQRYFKMKIGVAHFNHQLRGRMSDNDEKFVKTHCDTLRISFFSGSGDVQKIAKENRYSPEEAARIERESFLKKCLQQEKFTAIATAHHLNDQAETILMRLFSGAGLDGLAGIRLQREKFIRPLLFAEKTEIEAYAKMNKIGFREDVSNLDTKIPRNKIRHQLLPLLKTEFQLSNLNSFLHSSLILQELLPEIHKAAETAFEQAVTVENQNKIRLDILSYTRYFSWIQVKLLERILTNLVGRKTKVTYNQHRDFLKWLNQSKNSDQYLLHGEIRLSRSKEKLIFKRQANVEKTDIYELLAENAAYQNTALGISVSLKTVLPDAVQKNDNRLIEYIDMQHIQFPLVLRNWRSGDRFQPLGLTSPKKISDFLTDEKKLIFLKPQMLVLENQGEIVAVIGARISEKYKIRNHSNKILKIEVQNI